MRIVGLTGGIASGKSTASKEFQALGIPIVDADKVAHAALRKGTLAWRRVVRAFGEGVLQENGEVDRARLGEMIFSDPALRKKLNMAMSFSIATGLYWELFKHWMKGTRVVIMDVPLLFEARLNKLTKPVIVVWVDADTQVERLMKRDKISKDQAAKKIVSQLPLDVKRDRAELVIDNCNSLDATKKQVLEIYEEITAPLTWKELVISRNVLLTLGVAVFAAWFFMK
eukprot:c25321_g5_i1 orf=223-903(-)